MAKSKKRVKQQNAKRLRQSDTAASGSSNYARKKAYLRRHNVFGFQVPEPKPWKH